MDQYLVTGLVNELEYNESWLKFPPSILCIPLVAYQQIVELSMDYNEIS